MKLKKITQLKIIFIVTLLTAGVTQAQQPQESTGDHDIGGLIDSHTGQPQGNDSNSAGSSSDTRTQKLGTCYQEGSKWVSRKADESKYDLGLKSELVFIVFDEYGNTCFRSKSAHRITQGDNIFVAVYGPKDKLDDIYLDIPTCSLETPTPRILDTGDLAEFKPQAGKVVFREFQPVECFDDQIEFKLLKTDQTPIWDKSIKQYQRFHGTFQIGAIWTDLDDRSYSTVDYGSGPVITTDKDDSSGPLWVGSLVVYGIPHYFKTMFTDKRYSGRDVVNENSFADKLGLAFSFGLDDPKDTLGLGLSYEIATGINLTATQIYRRVDVLDGVKLGDCWTSGNVPTKESWEDDFVLGLSIDLRYVAKFFGGS